MSAAVQLVNRLLEGEDPKAFLKSLPRRKTLEVGEVVCRPTSHASDIIRSCLRRLEDLDPARFAEEMTDEIKHYLETDDPGDDFDPDYYAYEKLQDLMQDYCPPFTTFGWDSGGDLGCNPPEQDAIDEWVDDGKLTVKTDEPEIRAIERGDFSGIATRYVLTGGHYVASMTLWDKLTRTKIWDY